MKNTIALISIILLGCQLNKGKVQKTELDTSNNISKIQAYLKTADSTITAVMNRANIVGLSTASTAVKDAIISATDALTSFNKLNAQINTLSDTVIKQTIIIENYHKQWIGDRTKFWAGVIIAGWSALGVTAIVLRVMAGGAITGGFAANAAKEIIRFLPLGNIFAWTANLFQKKPASV